MSASVQSTHRLKLLAGITLLLPLLLLSCNYASDEKAKKSRYGVLRDTLGTSDYDTISTDEFSLIFTPHDSVAILDFLTQQKIKITGGQRAYFTQYPNGIGLPLSNGDTVLLNNDTSKSEAYFFYAHLPSINHYLVRKQYPEGSTFILVNRDDGRKISLIGLPFISPSGRYMVALSMDLIAGHSQNAIQLLKAEGSTYSTLASIDLIGWGAEKLQWVSDTTFLLEKQFANVDTAKSKVIMSFRYAKVHLQPTNRENK